MKKMYIIRTNMLVFGLLMVVFSVKGQTFEINISDTLKHHIFSQGENFLTRYNNALTNADHLPKEQLMAYFSRSDSLLLPDNINYGRLSLDFDTYYVLLSFFGFKAKFNLQRVDISDEITDTVATASFYYSEFSTARTDTFVMDCTLRLTGCKANSSLFSFAPLSPENFKIDKISAFRKDQGNTTNNANHYCSISSVEYQAGNYQGKLQRFSVKKQGSGKSKQLLCQLSNDEKVVVAGFLNFTMSRKILPFELPRSFIELMNEHQADFDQKGDQLMHTHLFFRIGKKVNEHLQSYADADSYLGAVIDVAREEAIMFEDGLLECLILSSSLSPGKINEKGIVEFLSDKDYQKRLQIVRFNAHDRFEQLKNSLNINTFFEACSSFNRFDSIVRSTHFDKDLAMYGILCCTNEVKNTRDQAALYLFTYSSLIGNFDPMQLNMFSVKHIALLVPKFESKSASFSSQNLMMAIKLSDYIPDDSLEVWLNHPDQLRYHISQYEIYYPEFCKIKRACCELLEEKYPAYNLDQIPLEQIQAFYDFFSAELGEIDFERYARPDDSKIYMSIAQLQRFYNC